MAWGGVGWDVARQGTAGPRGKGCRKAHEAWQAYVRDPPVRRVPRQVHGRNGGHGQEESGILLLTAAARHGAQLCFAVTPYRAISPWSALSHGVELWQFACG
ncbi:hypothetical protein GCM10010390_36490 [Streptomyces mordarskii]|uniref:Uncharacterized protein n=1 Tax=Streptomyces mordarskii TaxID=1226758 RepID=A0ABN1D250_9ACTN